MPGHTGVRRLAAAAAGDDDVFAALRCCAALLYRGWRSLLPLPLLPLLQDLLSRDDDALPELSAALLEVACREMGVGLDRQRLRQGCAAALQAIHEGEGAVVVTGGDGVGCWTGTHSAQHKHAPPTLNCSGGSRHADVGG